MKKSEEIAKKEEEEREYDELFAILRTNLKIMKIFL